MSNCFFHFAFLCLLLLTAGCRMDFDYAGQSFAPRPEFAPVTFFNGRKEIPAEGFRIIGRGTLSVAPKTGDYESSGELREQARKHGADAVCIVEKTVRVNGFFPESQDEYIPPHDPKAKGIEVKLQDGPWAEEELKTRTIVSGTKNRPVQLIRFLFLKKSADLEKELKPKNQLL